MIYSPKKKINIKYVSKKNFLRYFTSSVINVTNGGLTSLESIYLNKNYNITSN